MYVIGTDGRMGTRLLVMPKIVGSTLGLIISLLFFFVQHIKVTYFNTFKSTCDFWTTNLTDLDAFAEE